ncbi:hypothetical protein [Marinobacter oulmenensis]|uniref:Uncharacterized protein n=1 Tax=Marinobacter oulmenensis TaxID=643747 RepID=A0A840U674_9GAMM|nr:hypothetical protein [Marinobacter oulmenensis]MBB5320442.1 hypothetical protein [Marinobacter oulmenensis]
MSKKRQTRKKRNSNQARDQRLFANSRVWTWEGMPSPETGLQVVTSQRYTPFGWIDMGQDLAQHMLDYPRNWSIGVRALCRNIDGKEWMESCVFDLPSYNIQRIQDAYHNLRAEVLNAQRTDQVYDIGWICRTWIGEKPEDPLELWHYHDAPAGIIRQALDNERQVQRLAGPDYSQERQQRWQEFNTRYLEERKRELEEEQAA